MKRIVVLLTVVALMVVMLAMGVAPAFAAKNQNNCHVSARHSTITYFVTAGTSYDRNGDGIYCGYQSYRTLEWTYADNHPKVIE